MKMKYKLGYKGMWGSDVYFLEGFPSSIDKIYAIYINDTRVSVINGKVGHVEDSDCVPTYSNHFYIQIDVFGVLIDIDINKIVNEIDVYVKTEDVSFLAT